MRKNSLLITTELSEHHEMVVWGEKNNWKIQGASFLRFEFFSFQPKRPFEVVFFSSIRSFQGFISGYLPYDGAVEFACIGAQTADKIKALGYPVHFVGEKAGDPSIVAQKFKSWLGNRNVLFPISEQSAHSISSAISDSQKEECVVYRSVLLQQEIKEDFDVLVFTSPSNWHAYSSVNGVKSKQHIIAWGKTTERALLESGVEVYHTLEHASFSELIDCIQKLPLNNV